MGSVEQAPALSGQAYEVGLPWGPVVRGVHWGSGKVLALFLHEPGEDRDLDAWGDLPERLAAALAISAIVVDLPGHGLSDDPWEPERLPEIVPALVGESTSEHSLLIVAARESATAALAAAASLRVAGVIALSAYSRDPDIAPPRTPATAKLFFAGAHDGESLSISRGLASSLGGWAVVTSIPTDTHGAGMLATEWGPRLREHTIAFARNVLMRQQASRAPGQQVLPER